MQIFISTYKKKISFYTGENHKTYKSMGLFKKKLNEEKSWMVLFFHISNFVMIKQKRKFNKKSIDKNFTIYLAREKMIINKKLFTKKDLIFFKKAIKILLKLLLTHSLNVCKFYLKQTKYRIMSYYQNKMSDKNILELKDGSYFFTLKINMDELEILETLSLNIFKVIKTELSNLNLNTKLMNIIKF